VALLVQLSLDGLIHAQWEDGDIIDAELTAKEWRYLPTEALVDVRGETVPGSDLHPIGLEPGLEILRLPFQPVEFCGIAGDLS
jgi:hypothetical protein